MYSYRNGIEGMMEKETVVYKGTIKGKFKVFKNSTTTFEMADGQIWRQAEAKFLHSFKQCPEVRVVYIDNKNYLEVQGIDEKVEVRRIK
jgi:hypothetical protein